MASAVTVTRIEQRAQLSQLEAEWDKLLEQTEVASPFLTPGWQFAWLDTYGAAHRPFVLGARHAGELVGLWPLGVLRRGPFRILEPLGVGRSDWLDVLALPDQREPVLSAFIQYLADHRSFWDLIELRDILADSPSVPIFNKLCSQGSIRLRRQPRTVAPYLRLEGTWEQFLTSKRGKFRSNLKYYRRLAERDGQRVDIQRLPWEGGLDPVNDLAAIELRSWKAREGNLKVSTPLGLEFYRRFCRYFADRGWLEDWRVAINSMPVAFVLNIIYRGKCYHYNTSYGEESAYMSPGMLLHAQAIADAFERGLTEYDFLSGDEPYKERWCSDRRHIDHLALFHRRPTSLAAQALFVEARWAFRRSEILSRGRQRLLSMVRKFIRRDGGDNS